MFWVYIIVPLGVGLLAGTLFAVDANTKDTLDKCHWWSLRQDSRGRNEAYCVSTNRQHREEKGWLRYSAPHFFFGLVAGILFGAVLIDPIILHFSSL